MSDEYRSLVIGSNDRRSGDSILREETTEPLSGPEIAGNSRNSLDSPSSPHSPDSPNSPDSLDSPNSLNSLNSRLRRLALWVGFSSAAALLSFGSKYLDDLTRQRPGTLFARLVEEGTGVYAATLLLPFVIMLARRYRLGGGMRARRIPIHLLAVAVFSVTHTSMNWGLRAVLFPAFGHGRYDYGLMPIRYLMEAPVDVIIYGFS